MSGRSPLDPQRDPRAKRGQYADDGLGLRPAPAPRGSVPGREVRRSARSGRVRRPGRSRQGPAQPAARTGYLPLGPDGRPVSRRAERPPSWQEDRSVFIPESALLAGTDRATSAAASTLDQQPQRRGAALRRFPRENPLFCGLLLVAAVVRVVVMLGYPPALWFPDSLPYIQAAMPLATYAIRPMGYSFLLLALEPFHGIVIVTAVQHAMGLAMGVLVYVLLRRRYGLPSWAATLAAVPPLMSAYGLEIEHFVLSDTFFALLITIAIVLVLWRPVPAVWMCAVAGLLVGASAVVRSQGMLLAIPFALYLATRVGAKRRVLLGILAMCAMFAVPLVSYASWYDQVNGSFDLTTSNGAFLYSRVAAFADCSVIKPPADERWLCISTPVSQRQSASYYVWNTASPINRGHGWEFANPVNGLATNFAIRAIEAQPVDYLKVVWHATAESFAAQTPTQKEYLFPEYTPQSLKALAHSSDEDYRYGYRYNNGVDPSTRVVQPFSGWVQAYQNHLGLPGPLLGLIVLLGLLGIAAAWRRLGGWALLPWLTGIVLIVTPAATADFDERYLVASVPAFCIAAAIGMQEISRRAWRAGSAPAGSATASSAITGSATAASADSELAGIHAE